MKKILPSLIAFLLLSMTLTAFAQVGTQNPGNAGTSNSGNVGTQNNPSPVAIKIANPFKCGNSGNCTIEALLITIVDELILPIGGTLCVLAFIYSGFLYVTAQGNTTKIQTAHRALLYAAIGTALLLGAKVFATVIENTVRALRA